MDIFSIGVAWADSPLLQILKCNNCLKPHTEERPLKRCTGGCLKPPSYCSKACQKAMWPAHKTFCRPAAPTVPANTIHESQTEVLQALTTYVDAHKWAISTAEKIGAFLKYGASYPDRMKEHHFARFTFRAVHSATARRGTHRDPSRAFTFAKLEFLSPDDWAQRAGLTRAESVAQLEQWRTTKREIPTAAPIPSIIAGYRTMLVMCSVEGLGAGSLSVMSQLCAKSPGAHLPPGMSRDTFRTALEDLLKIALQSLDAGLPIRKTHPEIAVPGKFSRVQKRWTWAPLFGEWEEYDSGRTSCGRLAMLEGLRSGLPVQDLMICGMCV